MSDLSISELSKGLQRVDETLAILIAVANETTPALQAQAEKLKREVASIANTVNAGFDTDKLKQQAKSAINAGVSESDLAQIQASAEEATKALTNAVKVAEQSATYYEKNAGTYSNVIVGFIAGTISFVAGALLVWGIQYNRIDRYQYAISQTDTMAKFLNSNCQNKKAYAAYLNQSIDCKTSWWGPSEIVANQATK